MDINTIIKVSILREQVSQNIRDLNTPAYISVHERFTAPELFRKYSDTDSMIEDGFLTTDSAYIAAQRVFSQNPRPQGIIIGKAVDEDDVVDWVSAVRSVYNATDEFVVFGADITTDADKELVAEYAEQEHLYFITRDSSAVTLTTATTDLASKLKAKSLQHTAVFYTKDSAIVAPEMAYIGRHVSADLGSNLWGYKTLAGLVAERYSTTEQNNLMAKNVQFYTNVGKDSVVVGNMASVGGERIHVMLGIFWMEIRIAERYWNLLYTNERILFTSAGVDRFKAELYTVLSQAVLNQIITNDTPFQITVPDVNLMSSQQRASGVLSGIGFRARLAGAIIFVNGVQGVVYA